MVSPERVCHCLLSAMALGGGALAARTPTPPMNEAGECPRAVGGRPGFLPRRSDGTRSILHASGGRSVSIRGRLRRGVGRRSGRQEEGGRKQERKKTEESRKGIRARRREAEDACTLCVIFRGFRNRFMKILSWED